jgi:hypothetical protein
MKPKEIFERYDIDSVWHFTDKSNLKSIEEYGILSLRKIVDGGVSVNYYGADSLSHSLDRRYGLDKYVHLAFINDHPMYHIALRRGSIVDPVWIKLDISMLYEKSTRFCKEVANQSGSKIFTINDIEKSITFEKMFSRDFWTRVEARKAEIMVANRIDTDKILGVYYG